MRLIVIGGGAAGFFCAINAARMNPLLEVTIVEKTTKLLSKVKISGGGRCNVTHACFSIPELSKKYPRGGNFVKKSFYEFFTTDTIDWFKERGVRLKTESDGRMFPVSDTSATIIDCLLGEADKYRVRVKMQTDVKRVANERAQWRVEYANGENDAADFLCVACGGYPKEQMFDWLKDLGHSIEPPVPSLFTFNMPDNPITELTGIATPAKVKIQGTKFEEEGAVLITHWGLSGPTILKLSAVAARELNTLNYRFRVSVNWLQDTNEQQARENLMEWKSQNVSQKVVNASVFALPRRLWEYLCALSGINEELRWSHLPSVNFNLLIRNVCSHEMNVDGKTTYKEEFVTAGGIKLIEVNPQTMESRKHANLFFAGEILDVDGVTGGFNFQHAWTSGWIAARTISNR